MLTSQTRDQFLHTLDRIDHGSLRVTMPEGDAHAVAGTRPGPAAVLEIRDWRGIRALAARGDVGLTEAYRDGLIDTPDLTALLTFGLLNEDALERYVYGGRLAALAMRLHYAG